MSKGDWRAAAARRRRRARRGLRAGAEPAFTRLFARFAITGVVAMIIIGSAAFVIVRRSSTAGAVRAAAQLANLAARGIAQPLITPGVLRGDPGALDRLDRVIHQRIIGHSSIVRVKIWNAGGRVIYSDARGLIGSVFSLGPDELRALRLGGTSSDASDLARPENRTERPFKRLLEVYVGIHAPGGARLLYEDYERSSTISASSRRQWQALLPVLGGALLVLYLVQVPLAYALARSLADRQRERAQLLQRAIEASYLERRQIAADLHDSAVQRLAGVSLSLAAFAPPAGHHRSPEETSRAIASAAAETRETIRELRTLLVDIYPPTLQRSGLPAALSDLVAPLERSGTAVSLMAPDVELPEAVEELFYRVAQEALRNVRTHGDASRVEVRVQADADSASLTIADDGRGFAHTPGTTAPSGHFGLRLMHDLVEYAGGELDVRSAPGNGTRIPVRVSLR